MFCRRGAFCLGARGSYRVSWRVMKRRQRNQHDRLPFPQRFLLRQTAGHCPVCTGQLGKQAEPAVISRRSSHSVTFRCKACDLQWTITWASLHRAAFSGALWYTKSDGRRQKRHTRREKQMLIAFPIDNGTPVSPNRLSVAYRQHPLPSGVGA
jgi:hypothetical protein